MLARDSSGIIAYYERTGDFSLEFDEHCDRMPTRLTVIGADANMMGANQMEIKVELAVSRPLHDVRKLSRCVPWRRTKTAPSRRPTRR